MKKSVVTCSVCGSILQNSMECQNCGFDESTDLERYGSFMVVQTPPEPARVRILLNVEKDLKQKYSDKLAAQEKQLKTLSKENERLEQIIQNQKKYADLTASRTSAAASPIPKQPEKQPKPKKEPSAKLIKLENNGQTVYFGRYPQHESSQTRSETDPIEWVVLKQGKGKLLLMSRYALKCEKYHLNVNDIEWQDCSLRAWLNEEFIESAFTKEEQNLIRRSMIPSEHVEPNGQVVNQYVQDKVFLLSTQETEQYLRDNKDRICSPTQVASRSSVSPLAEDRACWWWLRTRGKNGKFAACVSPQGRIYKEGRSVTSLDNCVRPAMWVTLD